METLLKPPNEAIREKILKISGEDYYKCYQCGECSSGCPSAERMDILPNQTNMLLMNGQFERVLESKTIWVCVACFECGERCPHGIDIAKIHEALRQIKIRKNFDSFNIREAVEKEVFPTVALVASFRKFTA